MALYSDIVMDHFMHPRNVGEIPDATELAGGQRQMRRHHEDVPENQG